MKASDVQIEGSWREALKEEFEKPYFEKISQFLRKEIQAGKTIYPPGKLIFNAYNSTPFNEVKVVIIGQDPYHGPEQAMGLSFSVPRHIRVPASLKNIYKELNSDCGIPIPNHGDLTYWANQGVFLLNAMLSVEHKSPGSHKAAGWQEFTDATIRILSEKREGLIFLLWGNFAKSKKVLIDELKHYVFESSHPSPLAGNRFSGNKHFSKTNDILTKAGKQAIDWSLP